MLVKIKFKLKFFNQADSIFLLSPIPNYHSIVKALLGDIVNWESTKVKNVILNNIIFATAIFKIEAWIKWSKTH